MQTNTQHINNINRKTHIHAKKKNKIITIATQKTPLDQKSGDPPLHRHTRFSPPRRPTSTPQRPCRPPPSSAPPHRRSSAAGAPFLPIYYQAPSRAPPPSAEPCATSDRETVTLAVILVVTSPRPPTSSPSPPLPPPTVAVPPSLCVSAPV